MRRFVLALAALGAVALSACAGGGSVFGTGGDSVDRTIITATGPSNIARVLPGASIALSATAVRDSANGVVNVNRFIWSAALVSSGSYTANTDGGTKPCGTVTFTPTGSTTPSALTLDMNLYVTIDPVNEANILFTPPTVFPLPASFPPGSGTIGVNYPYCVVVSATPLNGTTPQTAAAGSIVVAVVNPANPLQ
jgi:hypothetical protein